MTEFSIYQINMDRDTANVCFIILTSRLFVSPKGYKQ